MNLSAIRMEYRRLSLSKQDANPDPFIQFQVWLRQAIESGIEDASSMALSTVSASGFPSSRMVLLKELDEKGFVFYTNYTSKKGTDLETNNSVAILFYWKELERQVRVTGTVQKISRKEAEDYFASRPLESRISAAVSPQSQPVPDRKWLQDKWDAMQKLSIRQAPALPDDWGGYRVDPGGFEFFQGREHRLHDRISYTKIDGGWKMERLAP